MIRLAWLYFSVALCTLLQYFSSKIQIRGLKKVSYSVIYLLTFLWNIIFCIKYSHFFATLRAENLFENLYIEMMFALFQTYCSNQIAHYEVIWQLGSWLRRELPFLSFAERERDRKRRLLTVALEFRYSCSVWAERHQTASWLDEFQSPFNVLQIKRTFKHGPEKRMHAGIVAFFLSSLPFWSKHYLVWKQQTCYSWSVACIFLGVNVYGVVYLACSDYILPV